MLLAASIVGLFVLPGPWNAILFGVAVVVEVGEIWLWIKFLERYRVRGGAEGMIGERAVVIEACEPAGRVRLRGEIWHADSEADEPLAVGDNVLVTNVDGLRVRVRRA